MPKAAAGDLTLAGREPIDDRLNVLTGAMCDAVYEALRCLSELLDASRCPRRLEDMEHFKIPELIASRR